jgi:AraC family transcriptional regulator of adaptative response/methylated-DNA-[protein]-cysteine methyltransferase
VLEEQHAAKIANSCRLIEAAEEEPTLDELAQSAGLSAYHFHRIFKAITGVTPKAYAIAHRQKRVREKLGTSKSVTEAIYDAGFNSSGRFYANSSRVLGMTPGAFRKGGASAEIRFAVGECSLGSILVAASNNGVCAISFGDEPDTLVRDLQDKFPRAQLIGGDADFEQLVAKVVGFVEAPRIGLDLPLDVRGTFRLGPPRAMPELRNESARRRPCAPSPEPAPPTRLPWRSRAIGSCEPMARCPAIGGASSASATCSTEKQNHEPRTSSDKVGQHRAAPNFPDRLASHC